MVNRRALTTTREAWPTRVSVGDAWLVGDLAVPREARGIVIFAHGSGSSRLSPRNQQVADVLDRRRLATLLIDLLTRSEELVDQHTAQLRFDLGLLAQRVAGIADWVRRDEQLSHLAIGLFGASTGGGAALIAAAERPSVVAAVVSRGGRPDLAGDALPRVAAPTLLIVGELDEPVIELNRIAMAQMRAPGELAIVPHATHLFEEPGTLEAVAHLAGDWFERYLGPRAQTA